jgi:transcriptional regulator with XRE-family HTH domain
MKRPRSRSDPGKHGLPYQLRELIEARGLSAYALAKLAGVDRAVILRFLAGERDIQLATAGRLAAALGLRLVEVGRSPRRAQPKPAAAAAIESIDPHKSM